jgi:hypothetical protein
VKNDLGGILIKNWSVFLPATVINIRGQDHRV